MNASNFTTAFTVSQPPQQVFQAIANVRGWWSEEIEGSTAQLNDEFLYHYEDVHICKIRLVEVIPDCRIVWHVLDNYFKFTSDKSEWKDTSIIFEVDKIGNQTHVRFTHQGLVPQYECYEICKDAWTNYIQKSLQLLITTGKGKPNAAGKPQTAHEKALST